MGRKSVGIVVDEAVDGELDLLVGVLKKAGLRIGKSDLYEIGARLLLDIVKNDSIPVEIDEALKHRLQVIVKHARAVLMILDKR